MVETGGGCEEAAEDAGRDQGRVGVGNASEYEIQRGMKMNGIATRIKELDGFAGDAALYRLAPPVIEVGSDNVIETREYVVVSAANVAYSGPETYIFAATPDGEIIDWCEMSGSERGTLCHAEVLSNAGYRIAERLPLALALSSTVAGVAP